MLIVYIFIDNKDTFYNTNTLNTLIIHANIPNISIESATFYYPAREHIKNNGSISVILSRIPYGEK